VLDGLGLGIVGTASEELEEVETNDSVRVTDGLDEVCLGIPEVSVVMADLLITAVKRVLVLSSPVTPMMVFALPSGIEKVPFPLWQSQLPFSAAGPQHQFPFPQNSNDPLFCSGGLPTLAVSKYGIPMAVRMGVNT